jgi:hypothetical protein
MPEQSYDIDAIQSLIHSLQTSTRSLQETGRELPCIEKNCTRILASVKMLELNIEDILEVE